MGEQWLGAEVDVYKYIQTDVEGVKRMDQIGGCGGKLANTGTEAGKLVDRQILD